MACLVIGFFPRGKSGVAFKEGKTTYGGDIVIDPSGGRLSLGHPACATPMLEAYEIFKQLRGEAETRSGSKRQTWTSACRAWNAQRKCHQYLGKR